MDILEFREFCLSLPLTTESTPFDETTLVFKVQNKMFALCDMIDFTTINLKCDPARAVELRERYADITPGYHMNKQHWNTVSVVGDLPENFIKEMVLDSYRLIVDSLPKVKRLEVYELWK